MHGAVQNAQIVQNAQEIWSRAERNAVFSRRSETPVFSLLERCFLNIVSHFLDDAVCIID